MKVSAFTFIRNAIKYDYPVVESISSILPLCDECVVAVGKSDDNTRQLVESINSDKLKIIDTIWDDSLRESGKVLAEETNKAYKAISPNSDWAFYIQADEIVHEKYYSNIRLAMQQYLNDINVDGLLFGYKHFYGSYDYIGESNRWYRNEIRIIRNNSNFYSYGDAQGFRKYNNQKLNVKKIDAKIYHYGWVKHPKYQQAKHNDFNKLWHDDNWINQNIAKREEFDYNNIDSLAIFEDTHPKVMQDRISKANWQFDYDLTYNNYTLKEKIQRFIEKIFGFRIGEYKNYRLLK